MFDHKKTAGKVYLLSPDEIQPSPYQARRVFDAQELEGLALSIRRNGLLQPVTVRQNRYGKYELVAGERRLRACRMAGLEAIPAVLCSYDDEQTAALGLLENLQRAELNPFEQARGLQEVLSLWGCTQADGAHRLGMAQPTLANKLRLLKLPQPLQDFVVTNGLSERHARAALRLPEGLQGPALGYMAKHSLTARAADLYVDQLLAEKKKSHTIPMVRDVRIFVNTINHAIRLMTDNGIAATTSRREGAGYIEYVVRIPISGQGEQPSVTPSAHHGAAPREACAQ